MASPGTLRRQAQEEALLRYAPQQASLQASLAQAIADRNSALGAAATAYHGISGAIHSAGPQVRHVYGDAQRSAAGTDAIAKQTLSGLVSSPGVDTIKAAYAHESAVGGAVLAKAMAARMADLSNRRIEAAAGRAYAVSQAQQGYQGTSAKLQGQATNIAAQQGLFTQTRYGQLQQADEQRAQQRQLQSDRLRSQSMLQGQRLQSQAELQSQRLTTTTREGIRNRKNARTLAATRTPKAPRYGVGSLTQAQETQRIDAIRQVASVVESAPPVPIKKNGQVVGQRAPTEKEVRQSLLSGQSPIGRPVPADLAHVAIELARNGWVSGQSVNALHARGLHVPQAWLPTVVRPHVRRRPR